MEEYKRICRSLIIDIANLKEGYVFFADDPEKDTIQLSLSGNNDIAVMYLVRDGLIKWVGPRILVKSSAPEETGIPVQNDRIYKLTTKGRAFIRKWISTKNIIK